MILFIAARAREEPCQAKSFTQLHRMKIHSAVLKNRMDPGGCGRSGVSRRATRRVWLGDPSAGQKIEGVCHTARLLTPARSQHDCVPTSSPSAAASASDSIFMSQMSHGGLYDLLWPSSSVALEEKMFCSCFFFILLFVRLLPSTTSR